jgi:hypothetical protein
MKNLLRIVVGVSLLMSGFLCQCVSAQTQSVYDTYFSIDSASPSTALFSPSDILVAGPTVAISYASLGLVAGDDMRDFTWGDNGSLYFSVDRTSVGVLNTAVNVQSSLNQAAGDVFYSPLNGDNYLTTNQNRLGLIPLIGPSVNNTLTPIDNIDGLSFIRNLAFAPDYVLAPGSPTLSAIGATPSDILTSSVFGPVIAVNYELLGLSSSDVIEGLAYLTTDREWLITLAPGSPTLNTIGATSSDILYDYANGSSPGIYATYEELGLLSSDNVDAIALVPEPSSALLVGFGTLTIWAMRRFLSWRKRS